MDRLQSMAVFVKAADSGSFSAAGAALGISSQMAGKHVSALEQQLGVKLLNRTTRRQHLTEVGQQYYERCKRVLAEVEAADALALNHALAPRGRLRISAPVTYGNYCLIPVLGRYLRRNPQVKVELSLNDRIVDLVDEGFDAVIRIGRLSDSTLVARPLAPYRLIACAAPAYLATHGTPRTPDDLAGHHCLGYNAWPSPVTQEWELLGGENLQRLAQDSRLQINDARAQRTAACEGLGIILGSEMMLADDLRLGRLVQLFPQLKAPQRQVHLLYARDPRMAPKLRSFVDQAVAELEHTPASQP
ncbi:LysR family transcriptional regulator [Pseudomonas carassii]|uniref:LysR family transcriptional regulator n=1 Tax=Pseudomonas carassii TaxID=3115855 RepID=A0ABU7H6I2_9PSED|nr:LysR family transcriptional regulator [Pseudomonas sp. 137P]MEE1886613.1 LysR family transcriptional regulator [Pseudomonas sp. 137P]